MLDQALELERADLGAVLLALARTLRRLVGIEFALDAVDAAVKHVHDRPQQTLQIGFEARVGEGGHERIEHIGEGALEPGRLRQRTRIGLIVVGPMAVERELVEEMGGRDTWRRRLGIVGEAIDRHRSSPRG